jgi:hypothetical protein
MVADGGLLRGRQQRKKTITATHNTEQNPPQRYQKIFFA